MEIFQRNMKFKREIKLRIDKHGIELYELLNIIL